MWLALQYLHRVEVAINRGAEGKTGRYFVPNISEERAVELASRFVSESFLFSVSWSVLDRETVWCTVSLPGRPYTDCGFKRLNISPEI